MKAILTKYSGSHRPYLILDPISNVTHMLQLFSTCYYFRQMQILVTKFWIILWRLIKIVETLIQNRISLMFTRHSSKLLSKYNNHTVHGNVSNILFGVLINFTLCSTEKIIEKMTFISIWFEIIGIKLPKDDKKFILTLDFMP